jgi:hypothetical protein
MGKMVLCEKSLWESELVKWAAKGAHGRERGFFPVQK